MEDVPACLECLLVRARRFHEGTSEWEAQWVLLIPGAIANFKILRSNLVIKQEATQKVGSIWRFNAMILMPTPAVAGHHILTTPPLTEHCISYFSHCCDKESQKSDAMEALIWLTVWESTVHHGGKGTITGVWSRSLTSLWIREQRGRRHLDVGLSYNSKCSLYHSKSLLPANLQSIRVQQPSKTVPLTDDQALKCMSYGKHFFMHTAAGTMLVNFSSLG